METFQDRLGAMLPLDMGQFMAACNQHYYATRDPFGSKGDFVTAPEMSQCFGEMLAISLIDGWNIAKAPYVHLVEIGGGRGTMMADMLRIFTLVGRGAHVQVHMVENSPYLRQLQADKLVGWNVQFHDGVSTLPDNAPLLIVANEFLDALPVRQAVRAEDGWQERVVEGGFSYGVRALPQGFAPFFEAPIGAIYEFSPERDAVVEAIAQRIAAQGGAFLTLDYGFEHETPTGDTLQAVYKHAFCPVFSHIGEADLTAHVNFGRLSAIGALAGCDTRPSISQGAFLKALGIEARAQQLAQAGSQTAQESVMRLIDPNAMGSLFRAGGFSARDFQLSGL